MNANRPTAPKRIDLGSARAATKAVGGTKLAESNMVFRYD